MLLGLFLFPDLVIFGRVLGGLQRGRARAKRL